MTGTNAMDDGLVFYTNPMSRGRVARWMLEEVGQPYRAEVLEQGSGTKSPAFLAINPMGKLPALTHGGTVVTETAAILAYLADAFPQAGLAPPPGDRARGPYYRWLFFAAGPVDASITNAAFGFTLPAKGAGMAGYGSLAAVLDAVEAAVTGRSFIAGDRFTAADVLACSYLGWGMMMGTIDARPAFRDYIAGFQDRPALRRAQALDGPMPAAA